MTLFFIKFSYCILFFKTFIVSPFCQGLRLRGLLHAQGLPLHAHLRPREVPLRHSSGHHRRGVGLRQQPRLLLRLPGEKHFFKHATNCTMRYTITKNLTIFELLFLKSKLADRGGKENRGHLSSESKEGKFAPPAFVSQM